MNETRRKKETFVHNRDHIWRETSHNPAVINSPGQIPRESNKQSRGIICEIAGFRVEC